MKALRHPVLLSGVEPGFIPAHAGSCSSDWAARARREGGLGFTASVEDKRACLSSLWTRRAFGRKPPCRAACILPPRFR